MLSVVDSHEVGGLVIQRRPALRFLLLIAYPLELLNNNLSSDIVQELLDTTKVSTTLAEEGVEDNAAEVSQVLAQRPRYLKHLFG